MTKISHSIFIEKAKIIHKDKYDYSKTKYINSKEKIIITCNIIDENNNIHGDFEMRADMHLFGKGCQKCNKQTLSTTEFIKRANIKHKNSYDYSKSKYIDSRNKIIIICKKIDENNIMHGEFEQIASNHLFGAGCPKCSGNQKLTINDFIIKSNNIYNNMNMVNLNKELTYIYLDKDVQVVLE